MAKGEASDQTEHQSVCVDCVDSRSTDHHQRTWLLKGVITAQIKCAGEHPDRQIVIQRRRSKAIYNAYPGGVIWTLHQDPMAAI